jgi:hypothetical protein
MNIHQKWTNTHGSPVMDLFFSDRNVCVLHQAIVQKVNEKTGYNIKNQSTQDLYALMREMYESYAENGGNEFKLPIPFAFYDIVEQEEQIPYELRNDPQTILGEVRKINGWVIQKAVNTILYNMSGYIGYLRDASQMPDPISRGVSTTIDRSLELFR